MSAAPYPVPTTDISDYGNPPGSGPLRPGGQPATDALPGGEENLPSTRSTAAKRQRSALTLVRDVFAGNEVLHVKGEAYLPRAPRETGLDYRVRLARAVFYNVFRNTVLGLTGFVFRVPPKLGDDVPEQIVTDWENIDLAGTHGDVFARDLMADAMTAGHAAILVDYPDGASETATYADDLRFRPYWVPLTKEQLVSWRTTQEDGRTVLTQLVVEETACVPVGKFGDAMRTRYRVFFRVATTDIATKRIKPVVGWQLLEVRDNKSVALVGAGLYPTQTEIPVAEVVTSGRKALFDSDPPLLDLAWINLAHYRQWSDQDSSIHMTCVPILFTAGMLLKDDEGNDIDIGPNSGLNSANPEAKASFVTHDGAALENVRRSLEDLENRMAALGLAAMATSKRVAETAKAKEMDKGASDSALAVTARGVEDGIERAFAFHAAYYGLEDGGSVEINTDFENLIMDAPTMTAWGALARDLKVPAKVVLRALIEGGRLPEDTDVEALALEMEAAAIAEADQQARELQMSLEEKRKMGPGGVAA